MLIIHGHILYTGKCGTVEPHYFDFSGETKKNSLKQWGFKMVDSKWLKDKSRGIGLEFEIIGNSKFILLWTVSSNFYFKVL